MDLLKELMYYMIIVGFNLKCNAFCVVSVIITFIPRINLRLLTRNAILL